MGTPGSHQQEIDEQLIINQPFILFRTFNVRFVTRYMFSKVSRFNPADRQVDLDESVCSSASARGNRLHKLNCQLGCHLHWLKSSSPIFSGSGAEKFPLSSSRRQIRRRAFSIEVSISRFMTFLSLLFSRWNPPSPVVYQRGWSRKWWAVYTNFSASAFV